MHERHLYNQINSNRTNNMIKTIFLLAFCCLLLCFKASNVIQAYRITDHNKNCYSQGLFFLNNTHLFESCGMYERSYFHILQYKSNNQKFQLKETFLSQIPYQRNVFFQGATLYNDHIFVLTWRQHIVYKLNRKDFSLVNKLTWAKQGWGITSNLTHLFITDGSDKVFLCKQNESMIQILQSKSIRDQSGRNVPNLNELQFVDGYLWMNVYMSTRVLKVDYESGSVVVEYDGKRLDSEQKGHKYDEVLNGIAYNQNTGLFVMTGKYWKNYYEVEIDG